MLMQIPLWWISLMAIHSHDMWFILFRQRVLLWFIRSNMSKWLSDSYISACYGKMDIYVISVCIPKLYCIIDIHLYILMVPTVICSSTPRILKQRTSSSFWLNEVVRWQELIDILTNYLVWRMFIWVDIALLIEGTPDEGFPRIRRHWLLVSDSLWYECIGAGLASIPFFIYSS